MESNDIYEQNQEYIDTIAELGRDKERLQKQLEIAVNTLKCYADPDNWNYNRFTNFFATWKLASDNLEKIKELDNE